jgi:hypothetical protein
VLPSQTIYCKHIWWTENGHRALFRRLVSATYQLAWHSGFGDFTHNLQKRYFIQKLPGRCIIKINKRAKQRYMASKMK